jgi:uncharacterized protein (TIGR02466 family)
MIEHWFATPIYYHYLEKTIFDNVFKEINSKFESSNFREVWDNRAQISNRFNENFLVDCQYTIEIIESNIDQYINSLSTKHPKYTKKIISSWLTLSKPGQYIHSHSHGATNLAGVLYISTNGKDGDIIFENPAPQFEMTDFLNSVGYANPTVYTPQNGLILLFPGWLKHSVGMNTNNSNRISLSFNYQIKSFEQLSS